MVRFLDFKGAAVSTGTVTELRLDKIEEEKYEIRYGAWIADETSDELVGEMHFRKAKARKAQWGGELDGEVKAEEEDAEEEEEDAEDEEDVDQVIIWTRMSAGSESLLDKFTLEELLHFMETHGTSSTIYYHYMVLLYYDTYANILIPPALQVLPVLTRSRRR
jgi:hypothetical protein